MRAARNLRKAVCRCGCGRMTVRDCVLSLRCIFLISCPVEVNACLTTGVHFRVLLVKGFACCLCRGQWRIIRRKLEAMSDAHDVGICGGHPRSCSHTAALERCYPWRQHPAHSTSTLSPTRANGLARHIVRKSGALAFELILSGRVIIATFRKWGRREAEQSVVHKLSCCYACLEEANGHHPRSKFFRLSHLQRVTRVRPLRPQLDGRKTEGNELTCLVRAIKAASSQKRKSTLLCTCMH